jgi:two-component system response regulator MprA
LAAGHRVRETRNHLDETASDPVTTTAEPLAHPARVLIADDEPAVLQMLDDLLTAYGYEVATAASGMDALDRLTSFPADVVLLDILMPGLSGNDTLTELRTRGIQVPAIAITGMPDRASTDFLAVLSKPIEMQHLTLLISVATRRRSAS